MCLNEDHLLSIHADLIDKIVDAYDRGDSPIEQSLKVIGDFYGADYTAVVMDDLAERGFVHLSHGWQRREHLTVLEARDLDLELRYG